MYEQMLKTATPRTNLPTQTPRKENIWYNFFQSRMRKYRRSFKFVPDVDTVTGHKNGVCPAGGSVDIHMPLTTAKLDLMRELPTIKNYTTLIWRRL